MDVVVVSRRQQFFCSIGVSLFQYLVECVLHLLLVNMSPFGHCDSFGDGGKGGWGGWGGRFLLDERLAVAVDALRCEV